MRLANSHCFEGRIAGRVGGDDIAAHFFCPSDPFFAWVHNHNILRVDPAFDQFCDAFRAGDAIAEHHNVVSKVFLDTCHAPLLPTAFDNEVIGRADKDKEYGETNWGNDNRFDQPGAITDGCDIAKTRGGDRYHCEIDNVEEAYLSIMRIHQPIPVPIMYEDHD